MTNRHRLLRLLPFACALPLVSVASAQEASTAVASVEVHMLANEGFLLRAGDVDVLIDAFVETPYAGYGNLDAATLDALVATRAPFDDVELALASHKHRDHFQPATAQRFLAAAPGCVFASSPDVIDTLWQAEAAEVSEQSIRDVQPAPGETQALEFDGVRVEFFELTHGISGLTNFGHVITLGGMKVLHIGDAEIRRDSFVPFAELLGTVDVALIPFWYFTNPPGAKILAEFLPDAQFVACHIQPTALDETTATLGRDRPEVTVFAKALDRKVFRKREASAPDVLRER